MITMDDDEFMGVRDGQDSGAATRFAEEVAREPSVLSTSLFGALLLSIGWLFLTAV